MRFLALQYLNEIYAGFPFLGDRSLKAEDVTCASPPEPYAGIFSRTKYLKDVLTSLIHREARSEPCGKRPRAVVAR